MGAPTLLILKGKKQDLTPPPEKLVSFILKAGGNPNARGLSGKPIYFVLISQGNQAIINTFYANGGNVNDGIGGKIYQKTPLSEALRRSSVETALFLVHKGADVNNVEPTSKNTAIHEAASIGDVDLLKSIIAHGGNVHQLNKANNTPLDIAIKYGRTDAEKYLREMQ